MEKIIFQLLSCLCLYDSGIQVPVCIRKPSRSTDYRPVAFIYRPVGQQTPGNGVHIPCRRSTVSWHRREVCAKSVDQLLASKGLSLMMLRDFHRWNLYTSICGMHNNLQSFQCTQIPICFYCVCCIWLVAQSKWLLRWHHSYIHGNTTQGYLNTAIGNFFLQISIIDNRDCY